MSISSEVSRNYYIGNGASANYAFTFRLVNSGDLKVAKRLVDKTIVPLNPGADYTISGVGQDSGGSITLLAGNLPNGIELVLWHDPAFIQDFSFINSFNFFPERHEKSFDRQVQYSQILKQMWKQAIKLNQFDNFDGTIPQLIPNAVVRVNAGATGVELAGPGEFIGPAGPQGNPWFFGTGDPNDIVAMEPVPNFGDIYVDEEGELWRFDGVEWVDTTQKLPMGESATAVGYSQRYGEDVNLTTLQEIVDYIFRFVYTAPAVVLSSAGSGTIREKGAVTSAAALVANTTKRTSPIATVLFYRGVTLIYTDPSPNPAGGTSTYTDPTTFTDTTVFRVDVTDAPGGGGGPTTVQSSVTYTFVYPYYYGAGADGLTPAQVAALTKDIITSNANLQRTIVATAGQHTYFAYPASYGALTSILDVNGFEVLPSWTASTSNITGLDGNAVSYRIYKGNNALAAGSYQFTFKR